jgi:hypothetical protein
LQIGWGLYRSRWSLPEWHEYFQINLMRSIIKIMINYNCLTDEMYRFVTIDTTRVSGFIGANYQNGIVAINLQTNQSQ